MAKSGAFGFWLLAAGVVVAAPVAYGQAGGLNFLFYGNSFTNRFSVPSRVQDISVAAGNPAPNVENAAVDSMTLGWHLANNTAVISSPKSFQAGPGFHWDALVLQEYSTVPTHIGDPASFRTNAAALTSLVLQASPRVQPVLFETWARGPGYPGFYPTLFADPSAMQQELHDNYQLGRIAVDVVAGTGKTRVAPIGDGFQLGNWTGLYDTDIYHASSSGALLAALTLYATIYQDTTSNINLTNVLNTLQLTPADGQRISALADAAVAANMFVPVPTVANPSAWTLNSNGSWSQSGDWSGGVVPNAPGAGAAFGPAISLPTLITVDLPRTVGVITLDNANGYTLGGPGTITLDGGVGLAAINVASGNHLISAPLIVNTDMVIATNSASSGVIIAGSLNAAGKTVTKTGAGTVQVQSVRARTLNIQAGTMQMAANSVPGVTPPVNVVNSLFIASGAKLDLADSSMIIDYAGAAGMQLSSVRRDLVSGRLTSSTLDAVHMRLGYGDGANLHMTTFAGQPVSATSVLVAPALAGDTNLDGKVDVRDLYNLASHWNASSVWTGGDFNYDGVVNSADLTLLAMNWQAGTGAAQALPLALDGSLSQALTSLGLPPSSLVPEPMSLSLPAALVWLTCCRRSRRVYP